MVGVTKVQRANASYWIEAVAEGGEDYYAKPGEAPGAWLGGLAKELGLEGEVGRAAYAAILEGRNPEDGEVLVNRPPTRTFIDPSGRERTKEPVLAYDVRFAAPKSVSLIYALGGEETRERLLAAYDRAVAAGISYLEREACFVQRGRGGKTIEPGQGFVAMAFRHRMSRAGDPALHTHVLVANMTRAQSDGRWLSLAAPLGRSALYQHGKAAGYVFQAQLRAELVRELGVEWGPTRNGYADIKGIERPVIEHFSQRRAEILEALAGRGASSAKAAEVAAYRTRQGKDYGVDPDRRREEWAARAQEFELTREKIAELTREELRRPPKSLFEHDLDKALFSLERSRSHFDRRDLLCAIAGAAPEGIGLRELETAADRLLASERVVSLGRPSDPSQPTQFTTPSIIASERSFLEIAGGGEAAGAGRVSAASLATALERHPYLGEDQREMVRRLVEGGERIVPIAALPGTGKTTALVVAKEAWQVEGHEVVGVATARTASTELSDAGVPATSIASLLKRADELQMLGAEPLARGTVIVVDEASTTATLQAAELAELAERCQGKLVMIGDTRQIGAVGPGGLFVHLTRVVEPSMLTEIRRQVHELDRRVVELAHAGRGSDALDLLRGEGRLAVADTIEEARHAALLDWHRAYACGADAVMIARRNRDVDELNAGAHALLQAEGKLGGEAIRVGAQEFAAGDRVMTRVNTPEVANRERFVLTAVDPDRGEVELQRIGGDGRTVTLGPDYLERTTPNGEPALEHAYAVTIYGSEGKTFDQTFALLDAGASQEELTVAVSRAREATLAYGVASLELTDPELGPGRRAIEDELHELRIAAERPGADVAAAEVALRERIAHQEVAALRARGAELSQQQREVQAQAPKLGELRELEQRLEWAEQGAERIAAERDALAARWFPPKLELSMAERDLEVAIGHLRRLDEERERLVAEIGRFEAKRPPQLSADQRLERELISERLEQVLRREVAAERLQPSHHVREAIGERPSDVRELETWNQAVQEIHAYRQAHGVTDPQRALGAKPREGSERLEWDRAQERLEERRRELERVRGIQPEHERRRERVREPSLELEIGR